MRPGASADKLQVKAAESLPLVGLARAMADQSTVGTVLRIYTGRGPSFLPKRYSLLAIMQRTNAMQPRFLRWLECLVLKNCGQAQKRTAVSTAFCT